MRKIYRKVPDEEKRKKHLQKAYKGNAAKHRITATFFFFKNTHKNNYLPSTLDKVWMRAAFSLWESILVMISIWKKTSKRLWYSKKKVLSVCIHLSFYFAQEARDWLGSKNGNLSVFQNNNHRIIEYLKLEGTHKDHWVQLPAPCRTA